MHLNRVYHGQYVPDYPVKVIVPHSRWWLPDFQALWASRELFQMFVKRQFLVRYRQMVLGSFWVVLEPLGGLLIFTLLFGVLLKVPSEGHPYVIFAFSGLIPWAVFIKTAQGVAVSLQQQMGIVSKVYFPRIILPLVAMSKEALDACLSFVLVMATCAIYGYYPTVRFLFLPVVGAAALLSGFAVGLLFTAPIVRFRDLNLPLTYALQLAMFVTPIVYPPKVIPAAYLWLMELNPMYWVVSASRWCLLGQPMELTPLLGVSAAGIGFLLLCGWLLFAYTERSIVDVQ